MTNGVTIKLLKAFQERRRLLTLLGNIGLRVFGPAECKDTNLIREFLDKNFVPYSWQRAIPAEFNGDSAKNPHGPVVDCGNDVVLKAPTLQEVAHCAGV